MIPGERPAKGWELVIPNPKLKLLDQVREVMRVKFTRMCCGRAGAG